MNAPAGVRFKCWNFCIGEPSGCYHQCLAEEGYYLGGKTKQNKTKQNKTKQNNE